MPTSSFRETWRESIVGVSFPTLLGTMHLSFRKEVHVRVVRQSVSVLWADILSIKLSRAWAVLMTLTRQRPILLEIPILWQVAWMHVALLGAMMVRSLPSMARVEGWESILSLRLWATQFSDSCTKKWLTRVLGNGKALKDLSGPRAVSITKGLARWSAMLLMATRSLLTVLSRVDRAWGAVWPTLLVSIKPAKSGLGWNLNLLDPRPQKPTLARLEGSRLGANRICPKLLFIACVNVCRSTAPLALGPLLSNIRFL